MKKILVVDDISTNRIILRQTLTSLGDYEVVEAVDGRDAIEQFEKEKPDLILMDIMMPDIDGCQASRTIKGKMGDDYTPIIFVTALSSDDSLVTALSSGGDDYLTKPFNVDVLESKIIAHLRIRELTLQLNKKNELLSSFNQRLITEQELVEHFFEKAIQQSFLDEKIIKYHMSSMSAFNGDLLLSERGPNGGIYLITGDFSGHGLSAAMGTLPVALIFFKMAAGGFSVGDIAREINFQLYKLLPCGMFFTASILELNRHGDTMSIWMGGMPKNYWMSKSGELKGLINSQHMPLGILHDDEFDSSIQAFDIENEDKIYLYSDGIVEAKNPNGELFGEERLKDILVNGGDNRFDEVLTNLNDFTCEQNQNDDVTLVEFICCEVPAPEIKEKNISNDKALTWNFSVSLSIEDMRMPNPVNKLSELLGSMPHISRNKGVLHVLLTEIYSNALDHSILNFESEAKTDEDHFDEYYKKRDEALLKLKDAFINFDFRFFNDNDSHYLDIQVTDSGCGFQKKDLKSTDEQLHGRGLEIIRNFTENMSFSDDGKTLHLLYKI